MENISEKVKAFSESTGQNEYWVMEWMMTDPWSYLTVVLVSVLSVLPRLIVLVSKNEIRPNAWFQLRHQIFNEPRKSV